MNKNYYFAVYATYFGKNVLNKKAFDILLTSKILKKQWFTEN